MYLKFFEGLSNEDMHNIKAIAVRYVALDVWLVQPDLIEVIVDITTYHQNVAKLDLASLAAAPRDNTIKVTVSGLRQARRPIKRL